MRKVLLTMATALAIISCQQEEFPANTIETSNNKDVQLVQIIDGMYIDSANKPATKSATEGETALRFDSESTYQSFLDKIKEMPSKERIAFVKSYGLTSLQEIASIADKELDSIGEIATNEADFKMKYDTFKDKYEGILITNKYDSSDLSLYVPDGDNLSTYILNNMCTVVIGNKMNKVSLANDMSQSEKILFTPDNIATRAITNEASGKYTHNGAQKTTYGVTLQQNTLLKVHIGFQKKMWYGWKRDNARDAYYFLDASPFQYNWWMKAAGKNAPLYQMNISRPDLYFFDTPGTTNYECGYIVGGSKVLTGKLYVWTDYTVEKDLVYCYVVKGNASFQREQMPRCDKAKAYVLNFSVNYLW